MDADELVRAIRAALDETERIARAAIADNATGHWHIAGQQGFLHEAVTDRTGLRLATGSSIVHPHIVRSDPAAVLRRVAADRELVNMAENAFLSAGVFRDIDERWGAVEMQYLHVMRTLARGLGITPEEETP